LHEFIGTLQNVSGINERVTQLRAGTLNLQGFGNAVKQLREINLEGFLLIFLTNYIYRRSDK
jgi:hypothetical protein